MSLVQEIVEKGNGIYKAKYKRDCERRYFGQYIAVDVETGDGFIAPSAAAAIRNGQSAGKQGALFRLIRIGYKTGGNPTPH
jgi:hypothetical protein